jgi:sigma-B regulation protein RsbU (phosphoserine phosphatase)
VTVDDGRLHSRLRYGPCSSAALAPEMATGLPDGGVHLCDVTARSTIALPADRGAAAFAREFLKEAVCVKHGASVLDDAVLLASETVTNAVRHGRPPIVLSVECTGDAIEVRVRDESPVMAVAPELGVLDESGRGLILVELLSDGWGVDMLPGAAKEVWFRLLVPSTSAVSAPYEPQANLTGSAEAIPRIVQQPAESRLERRGRPDLVATLLACARDLLHADAATILLIDPSGTVLETVAAVGPDAAARQRTRVRVGEGFAGRIVSERQARTVLSVGPDTVLNPLLAKQGIRSLAGVPLQVGEDVIGVLHVGSLTPRSFTEDDLATLRSVAAPFAIALRSQLSAEDHGAAIALQRSLVPARLPRIPGLDLAARYIPAAGEIGGDWYDVFGLPDHRVGIVMGDVAGHGLNAAIVMGRLRSALRSYALDYEDPSEVLHRLDRKAQHFEDGIMATVLYATSAAPYETLHVSLAGHFAPLLVAPNHRAVPAAITPDLPLGVDLTKRRTTATVELSRNTSVALFTDGLVERRPRRDANGSQIDGGLNDLQESFHPGDAETACADIIDHLLIDNPQDDVALLVLRRDFPDS